MNHRQRRKVLHRKRQRMKRQLAAKERNVQDEDAASSEETQQVDAEAEQEERRRQEEHRQWLAREQQFQQELAAKKEREERERQLEEEQQRKIREEWEECQKKEKEEQEKQEKNAQERKSKQEALLKEATANENKGAWHNPIAPFIQGREREIERCSFFLKTGVCKFGESCSRLHIHPECSRTLLFPGMFACYELGQSLTDDYDMDLGLEYEENELYVRFKEFYEDVVPEFRAIGRVVQFKVCRNCEPHLRGNAYVQFRDEDDAMKAFAKFNGRWYAGRKLSAEFVDIASWKAAICGVFSRQRCPKGKMCNFLHPFKNPGNEFWEADRDMTPRDRSWSQRSRDWRGGGSSRRDSWRFHHRHHRSRSRSPCSSQRSSHRSRSRSPSRHRRSKRTRSRSRSVSRSPSRQRSSKSRRYSSASSHRPKSLERSSSRSTVSPRRKKAKSPSRSRLSSKSHGSSKKNSSTRDSSKTSFDQRKPISPNEMPTDAQSNVGESGSPMHSLAEKVDVSDSSQTSDKPDSCSKDNLSREGHGQDVGNCPDLVVSKSKDGSLNGMVHTDLENVGGNCLVSSFSTAQSEEFQHQSLSASGVTVNASVKDPLKSGSSVGQDSSDSSSDVDSELKVTKKSHKKSKKRKKHKHKKKSHKKSRARSKECETAAVDE